MSFSVTCLVELLGHGVFSLLPWVSTCFFDQVQQSESYLKKTDNLRNSTSTCSYCNDKQDANASAVWPFRSNRQTQESKHDATYVTASAEL